MMDKEPLVSVIITTYNLAPFIEETVRSVLKQTYTNKEIIIVDDGSTDGTVDKINEMITNYKDIYFFPLEHTGIPAKVRNHAIEKCSGKYIAFLDGDDIWNKNKLAIQVRSLENDNKHVLAYTMSVTFGDLNFLSAYYEVLPLLHKAAASRDELIKGNTITTSSVLVRADALKESGGFDEDPENKIEDYDLWLRLGEKGNYLFIPRILVNYRIHGKQFSGNWEQKQQSLEKLAKKRNLPLKPYRFKRNKSLPVRIARNGLHLLNYLLAKTASALDIITGRYN